MKITSAMVMACTIFLPQSASAVISAEEGGGVGIYIVGAVILVVLMLLGNVLGWLIETINRISGRSGDNEFASKVLLLGGFGSPVIGGVCAALFSEKVNFGQDLLFFAVIAFFIMTWWLHKKS